MKHGKAVAHRFTSSCVRSGNEPEAYWRDVGTIDAYWEANIDLTDFVPALDLYDRDWPIWTYAEITPPAKFVHDEDGRRGMATSSLVSGACIISGSRIDKSLLFTGVHAHSYSELEHVVALPYVQHRPRRPARAGGDRPRRRASRKGLVVGEDPELDAQRFRRTDKGVCLITQADDRPAAGLRPPVMVAAPFSSSSRARAEERPAGRNSRSGHLKSSWQRPLIDHSRE